MEESEAIRGCLETYAAASGQLVNYAKSDISFGRDVKEEAQLAIAANLGVSITACNLSYLGLPTLTEKRKVETFTFIRERVWAKLKSWRGIWFSQEGREVLIKSILQAIPSYAVTCFRLPKTLVSAIHKAVAKFWWGGSGDERKMQLCKWEELTKRKTEGGLGFRDLEKFNQALVAKSVWRIIRRPDSLIGRILRVSYFPNGNILEATCPSYGSNLWWGLVWGK